MLHRPLHALTGRRILSPGSISLAYLVLAGIWIYGSDRLLLTFVEGGLDVVFAQTLKGWAFVIGTALLLYVLLRRWESVILHSQDELRSEQQRYKALIEASPTPILTLDRDGYVTTWSPAAEAVLGWREEEVIGKRPPYVPESRTDEFQDLFSRVLEGHVIHRLETRRLCKDGTLIDVSLSAAPFGSTAVRGVEATLADITERKRYEEGLLEAKERAEEMSRLKSTFLTNMSHEIRTPLTSIMGFADILRQEAVGSVQDAAGHILAGSERLMETLGSLLDLAQLEGEEATLQPAQFDLCTLARETLARYERQAREQGLDIRFDGPESPIPVCLDPDAVERVLANLLSNAVKFAREGRVTLALQRVGEEIELRVADTGVGIAEDALASIFGAFQQESSGLSREFEGSGLGLTIAKNLVGLMGGTIGVESEKGEGTTFSVRLPAEAPQFTAPEVHSEKDKTPLERAVSSDVETAPATKKMPVGQTRDQRILLVEDNPANRLVVRAFISEEQAIDVVTNGRKAIQQAQTVHYDVVLLDISLGTGPSGESVLDALRQFPDYERTAIVAVTAHAMPGDQERFLAAGFDGYLSKPFSRAQLTETLRLAACVQHVRSATGETLHSAPLDEMLIHCLERGIIDHYDRSGETVTFTCEGVAVQLQCAEARAVLQMLAE